MQTETRTNIKLALLLAALIFVFVVGYFAYISISRSGKIPVVINAAPSDVHITLNNVEVEPGTVYLEPGGYAIKATKDGFADFTNTVQLSKPDQTISIPMTPVSEEAKKWANENQADYLDLEGEASKEAQEQGEAFRTKNPIINLLPHRSLLYTIGYRADPDDPTGSSIIIEIDASQGYRQQAIHQIQQWGYDPTDFKINFRDYENPFES